jgi:hypothetical protein
VSEPLAIVEFELAGAPHLLSTMDYTYRERHGEAIYRFKGLPSRRRGACPREGGGPALAKAGGLPSRRRGACPREGGGQHAAERLLPPQRRAELPGGRHRHSPTPTLTLPRLRGREG